jgi:hypothetical protein
MFDAFIGAAERSAQTSGQYHAENLEEDTPETERPVFSIRAIVDEHRPYSIRNVITLTGMSSRSFIKLSRSRWNKIGEKGVKNSL